MRRHLSLTLLAVLLAAAPLRAAAPPAPPPPAVEAEPPAPAVETENAAEARALVAELLKAPPEKAWALAMRLRLLRKEAPPAVRDALAGAEGHTRVVLAKLLCDLGEVKGDDVEKGCAALVELAARAKDASVREAAANALSLLPLRLYGRRVLLAPLSARLGEEADARVRVAAARAILRLLPEPGAAVVALLKLAEREDATGNEAVLVLAENGHYNKVRGRVHLLAGRGDAIGERAMLARRYRFGQVREDPNHIAPLLNEVMSLIGHFYVEKPTDESREALRTAAVRGMVSSLDPFSQYLDQREVKAMSERLSGKYSGIGAYVGLRDGVFTIESPLYNGPAYRADLRSLDRILAVDGKKTSELGFEETVKHLKGPAGTPVTVLVLRRGWAEPHKIVITREEIKIQSVYSEMLPGKIGYARLTTFGQRTTADLEKALAALEAEGMTGLVLDLRNNGGGLLGQAVFVASKFLPEGEAVVSSRSRFKEEKHNAVAGAHPDYPLVVLVNSGSASASEIVAGALQDHKRATLVGEKTYGKGSVQELLPLMTTLGKTRLKLTIARYYLPSGRTIHGEGVVPDIAIEARVLAPWKEEALTRLYPEIENYVARVFPKHKDILMKLAEDDGGEAARYPELAAFIEAHADEMLVPDDVRRVARNLVRRHAADARGRVFVHDLAEDRVLQRGALALLRKLARPVAEWPEAYRALPERFKEEAKAGRQASAAGPETPEAPETPEGREAP